MLDYLIHTGLQEGVRERERVAEKKLLQGVVSTLRAKKQHIWTDNNIL